MTKIFAFILLQFSNIQFQLIKELKAFQESEGIYQATVAASVQRISDKKNVLSFNSDKAINSASTLKLVTTATALAKLSSTFRYHTDLLYSGSISVGSLNGDLIIQSNGDPSFGSERGVNPLCEVFDDITETLKSLGVKRIKGNIIIQDETVFGFDMPDSWIWGDIGNYYGAIPHKFNVNENLYTVYFEPGKSLGIPAELKKIEPFDPDWEIINLVKTGAAKSGDQVYIYGSPGSETITLKGTVPLGKSNFPVKGSIPNPAKTFRTALINRFNEEGIRVEEGSMVPLAEDLLGLPDNLHLLKRFESQRLEDLVRDCNFSSINLYADAFLQTQDIKSYGFSDFKTALESTKDYWLTSVPNLAGFQPKDGSGLSPSGFLTAQNMTDILSVVNYKTSLDMFKSTIPILGQEGSVRYKDKQNKTEGRVHAKSGSIEGTRAFAGYLKDKSGIEYAFMVAVNRYNPEAAARVRKFLDEFLVKLGSY
ncbi:MAG: D-alanyl-D-alanine carboxypeptidase/D-alanyl-D-alanine-endopeptidase (penicillin-binding protein 4) [Psychromonas sp.]